MTNWVQVVVLSLVQGLTEFLPVSSSAHLILVPQLLGWQDQGLGFDIAVHLGTLLAVLGYFRRDLFLMLNDFVTSLKGQGNTPAAKVFWSLGFATIPVGLVGLLGKSFVEAHLRSPQGIALTTIGFGLLLWMADRIGRQKRSLENLNWRDTVVIGCAQAMSLLPGTSRSGITLTAGLWRGLTREAAARFSFLLSIPVILLAGGYELVSMVSRGVGVDWAALGLGILISAVSGYACIHYFLRFINRVGLVPFVLYRLALGGYLLLVF